MKELLPSLRHIFLFRSPAKSISSRIKVYNEFPPLFKALELSQFLSTCIPLDPTAAEGNFSQMILNGTMSKSQSFGLHILAGLRTARNFVEQTGGFDYIFTYEELLENEEEMTKLFGLFGMQNFSLEWKKHSQEKTFFNRKKLKQAVDEEMESLEEVINFLKLPSLDSCVEDLKKYINCG